MECISAAVVTAVKIAGMTHFTFIISLSTSFLQQKKNLHFNGYFMN